MILGCIPVVLHPRMPTEQVMGLVGGRSSNHRLPSAAQTMVAILLALAEDSCGNVDNIVRERSFANLSELYKHKCWMLEHPNNAVVCTGMSFSSLCKQKMPPSLLDGF